MTELRADPSGQPLGDSASGADLEATGVLSPAEERFERARRTVGLFAGPVVFGVMWAIVSLVVVWWATEAIPIPATALLGAVLATVCGVASATAAFAPFASPTIFLFMGSFMIGWAAISSLA